MVDNIFQVIGSSLGNLAQDELRELEQLKAQEEQLNAMEWTNRFDENVNNYLLDKEKNYSYDGTLAAEAQGYFGVQKQNVLNGIKNKNVKNQVEANMLRLENTYTKRAEALQTSKHLQHQSNLWDQQSAESASRIALDTDPLAALDREIEFWEINQGGFTATVRDKALPRENAKNAKIAMDSVINRVQIGLSTGAIKTPEDAITQLDIAQQKIFKNLKTYKLSPGDVQTYSNKFAKMKQDLSTNGRVRYVNTIKQKLASQQKLIAAGEMSPSDPEYISNLSELQANSDEVTASAIEREYNQLIEINQASVAAYNSDLDGLASLEQQAKTAYETSKASNNPEQQLADLTTYTTIQKTRQQANKLAAVNQGQLFQNNPELKQVVLNQGPRMGFEYIGSKTANYTTPSQFRPMTPAQIESFKFTLSSQGDNFANFRNAAIGLREQYAGPVNSVGGKDGWKIATDNMLFNFAQKKKADASNVDPFTLDEQKTMLVNFLFNPDGTENQEFSFLYNYLISPTPGLDGNSKDKKALKGEVSNLVGKYAAARGTRSDLLSTGIPELTYEPLVRKIAEGHYELSPSKNPKKSAQYAVDQLFGKYVDILDTHTGSVIMNKTTAPDLRKVIQSRTRTSKAVSALLDSKNPDLSFPEIYKIENNIDKKVTQDAIRNNAQLQQVGDNEFALYLNFQGRSMRVLEKDSNRPVIFTGEDLQKYSGLLDDPFVYGYYGGLNR